MTQKKRVLPKFLEGVVAAEAYERWLIRKARAHATRDQKRFSEWKGGGSYRDAIHAAVVSSDGRDVYTGEALDWTLISKYNSAESKLGKHAYKAGFALLPTVDHIEADAVQAQFCICSWRTNDAKHDLNTTSFIELCRKVLVHHGYSVSERKAPE